MYTILVVDDEPWHLSWLKDRAAGWGAEVIFVRTYEEAVKRVDAERPDIVVLDIKMGEVDEPAPASRLFEDADSRWVGLRFLRYLRVEKAWNRSSLPVLVYTGVDREQLRTAVEGALQGDFFTKFEPQRFVAALEGRLAALKAARR
jgi:CheY-like chemotaxis protein